MRGSILADDSCLEDVTFATCQRMYKHMKSREKSEWEQNFSLSCSTVLVLLGQTSASISSWPFFLSCCISHYLYTCSVFWGISLKCLLNPHIYYTLVYPKDFVLVWRWKHFPFSFCFSQHPPKKMPAPKTYVRASLDYPLKYSKLYNLDDTFITSGTEDAEGQTATSLALPQPSSEALA